MTDHTPVLLSGYSVVIFYVVFQHFSCYIIECLFRHAIGRTGRFYHVRGGHSSFL